MTPEEKRALTEALRTRTWSKLAKSLPTVAGCNINHEEASELLAALESGEAQVLLSLQFGGVATMAGESSSLPGSTRYVVDYKERLYIIGGGFDESVQEALEDWAYMAKYDSRVTEI